MLPPLCALFQVLSRPELLLLMVPLDDKARLMLAGKRQSQPGVATSAAAEEAGWNSRAVMDTLRLLVRVSGGGGRGEYKVQVLKEVVVVVMLVVRACETLEARWTGSRASFRPPSHSSSKASARCSGSGAEEGPTVAGEGRGGCQSGWALVLAANLAEKVPVRQPHDSARHLCMSVSVAGEQEVGRQPVLGAVPLAALPGEGPGHRRGAAQGGE